MDTIKGRFRYSNQPLMDLVLLIGILLTIGLMTYHIAAGMAAILMLFVTTWAMTHLPGSYTADSQCVTIKILWKTYRFSYSRIQSVQTEIRHLHNSRWDDTYSVEAELTIRTKSGEHVFCSLHSFSIEEQLNAPDRFKEALDGLALIQLGRYIEAQIG